MPPSHHTACHPHKPFPFLTITTITHHTSPPPGSACHCAQAFFAKWWREQSDYVRGQVRALVASGQLQFVNGGLVQHDEATSHYSSIVDQMGAGMRCVWGGGARGAGPGAA